MITSRPAHLMAAAAVAMLMALPAHAGSGDKRTAERPSEVWQDLKESLYPDRAIANAESMIALDTPYRAHDAAIVPVGITVTPPEGRRVAALTLIVDENPAPVAAEVEVGAGMPATLNMSTRVRVNAYSNVRVVAELDDGSLHQAARFVKASGGCSAPALKDHDAAMANIGRMKLRLFDPMSAETAASRPVSSSAVREAQVLVRHPNYSGLQMDQVTRLYIPAFFVDELEVHQGDALLLRVTGGISLSEDPSIRFSYAPDGAPLSVRAHDTDGGEFAQTFPTDIEG